jgi:hypothetical protein
MMHTPGPWTVDPKTLAVYAPDRHGHAAAVRVAECGRTLLPTAEIAANAALVAVAPDLLAALQLVYANAGESPEWIRSRIAPAIARAIGGQ